MQSDNESSETEERVYSVRAVCLETGRHVDLCYKIEKACGYGSFGEVSRIRLLNSNKDGGGGEGQVLALKRTRQDRRFKNRELSLMQSPALHHPNIIECKYAWQERNNPQDSNQVVLYLLLEYVPSTLYTHYRIWAKKRLLFPELLCKVYLFQLLRALAWCHAIGVCHRDIKPHNILIEYVHLSLRLALRLSFREADHRASSAHSQETGRTVLIVRYNFSSPPKELALTSRFCLSSSSLTPSTGLLYRYATLQYPLSLLRRITQDFGSAKVLKPGDDNVVYTCSRYYRAPELIFGNTAYTHAIDMWSVGCVLAELLAGKVVFAGGTGIDQLVEIIKVMGTPSRSESHAMNPDFREHSFPQIKPTALTKAFPQASPEAISLLYGLLRYNPHTRLTASEALAHSFFDEIKQTEEFHLPNGNKVDLDMLFSFSPDELSIRPDLNSRYIPAHYYARLFETTGVDLDNFRPRSLEQLHIDID